MSENIGIMHAAVGKLLAVPCFTVTGQLSEAAMR
jgi:hypothetical protein